MYNIKNYNFNELPFIKFVEILLLLVFLYQLLPSLSSIQTVEFTGKLREPLTKTIEIYNNSYQEMQYIIIQNGSLDFKLNLPKESQDTITLKEKVVYLCIYNIF